ncbi:MAG: shikimate kinase [Treponema sp.]|jgi:shikimate kinase|nr:shikimate kinase [Treponema sp.]
MGETIILLVGPKHSGKTSVARALAAALQCRYTDLDALVEARTGKKARALYKEDVEAFRKAEAEALRLSLGEPQNPRAAIGAVPAAAGKKYAVVSAGGGIIDNGDAVSYIEALRRSQHTEKSVVALFLEVSARAAWERIRRQAEADGALPPFLQTDDPEETHRLLHERRNRAYGELADFTLPAEHKTAENIATEILQRGCF